MTAAARCSFAHCPACHLPVHQHPDDHGRLVDLQPGYIAAVAIPARLHLHLEHGILHPGQDPKDFGAVRIEHAHVCPALDRPAHPALAELWRIASTRRRELTP